MPNFWIQTPTDDVLSEMRGWAQIDKSKYAAIRHYLLVVQRTGGKAVNGPIHEQMEWPVDTEYEWQNKITKVTKYTYGIQESITSTVTTKLSHEVLTKIGLDAGLSVTALQAKLSSELQTKIGTELINSLQDGLSVTRTYEISTSEETTDSIKIKVAAAASTKPIFVYFKLKPRFWDVYLYRTDYLQLEYRPRWYHWNDVRKTITSIEVPRKQPLFRVAYFEPEEKVSFKFDSYEPAVTEDDLVKSLPLTSAFPGGKFDPAMTLEELARIAFPISRKEKTEGAEKRKRIIPKAKPKPKPKAGSGIAGKSSVRRASKSRSLKSGGRAR